MIFRRSLVREMTATALGLFVILLGILFTNLMLKLLARAAAMKLGASGRSGEKVLADVPGSAAAVTAGAAEAAGDCRKSAAVTGAERSARV